MQIGDSLEPLIDSMRDLNKNLVVLGATIDGMNRDATARLHELQSAYCKHERCPNLACDTCGKDFS